MSVDKIGLNNTVRNSILKMFSYKILHLLMIVFTNI